MKEEDILHSSQDSTSSVTTLVLDAVTGKVILEHPRQTEDHEDTFQLSDSALLDGTVAYSLTDGSRMWDLPNKFEKSCS